MVIDASALLAYFQDEPGADVVAAALTRGVSVSCISWTEVAGKLIGAGKSEQEVEKALADLEMEIMPFEKEQMKLAAYFYARRKPYRLSLGDSVTLALAEYLGESVLTAEHSWSKLPYLRVEVKLIRP